MLALLRFLTLPEWRARPLRHATALLAVALGVALAFSVQLINNSALSEFSGAVRTIDGQPDFELRAQRGGFDEKVYAQVAANPLIRVASPVVDIATDALDANGERVPLRVLGIDVFSAAPVMASLMPQPLKNADRLDAIDPDALFLNAAARQRLVADGALRLQVGARLITLNVRGSIAGGGPPLAVMDIAGAQAHFGMLGRLSRIDVRLAPGADRAAVLASLGLPPGVQAVSPADQASRIASLSRAYRVNLTVLALVALFTGSFLVFSVLALAVAQRTPQLALLGVLGLSARERLTWVLIESALLGAAGSVLGLALGTALAAVGLRWLSGDLGGGYFPGVAPHLQFSLLAAATYGALGVAAAVAGGWLPARMAQSIAPARALKGLGDDGPRAAPVWQGPALLAAAAVLGFIPPIFDVPLAAYAAVACLLLGGIACLPAGVGLVLLRLRPPKHALALLAVERARDQRRQATLAVAGVVASLSLAVALTVMVASFRGSVAQWLDTLLPADLYVRTATSTAATDLAFLPTQLVASIRALPGVARVDAQRVVPLQLDATRPAVALIARTIGDASRSLPLVGALDSAPPGATAVYVSEAMESLYGARRGRFIELPMPDGRMIRGYVRGVWRDYARQHGAVAIALDDYRRLTSDERVSDLALRLAPGADAGQIETAVRRLAPEPSLLEFATAGEIRTMSLRIFDRSFAVTYWLQAIAIGIGLFGIAASFSAQVLARRKEFGLLAHLGLTRRDVLIVVAAEGAVWTGVGALLGLVLGLAVSVVLVDVVNPQSFHWTMDLRVPWPRLLILLAAVMTAGTFTAWWAGRRAASRDLALAVKEDW